MSPEELQSLLIQDLKAAHLPYSTAFYLLNKSGTSVFLCFFPIMLQFLYKDAMIHRIKSLLKSIKVTAVYSLFAKLR